MFRETQNSQQLQAHAAVKTAKTRPAYNPKFIFKKAKRKQKQDEKAQEKVQEQFSSLRFD